MELTLNMENGKRKRKCAKHSVFYTPENKSTRFREIKIKDLHRKDELSVCDKGV